MKITFEESEWGSWFTLEPENTKEVAELFRMTNNSKAAKPEIFLSFGKNSDRHIECQVFIKKLSPDSNKVENTIRNYK